MHEPQIDAWGIQQSWVDADGEAHQVPDATVAALREVIGQAPSALDERAPIVTRRGRTLGLRGVIHGEDGGEYRLAGPDGVVPDDVPFGYHRLVPDPRSGPGLERSLIVSPGRCVLPERPEWGWAAQVYALHSAGSQGIGDLADLARLREATVQHGGAYVMVNPLHAVAPVAPIEPSPYLPATRRFLNPLYLRVEGLGAAPVTEPIDHDAVWRAKRPALRRRFEALDDDARADLARWRAGRGESLATFATWWAISEEHGPDFGAWPEPLRDPRGSDVERFAAEHEQRIAFACWLQRECEQQLTAARGDAVLVQDLPVGFSGGGADAWAWRDLMAEGVTIGAPPDALNSAGQDWGSPPMIPWRLRLADYAPIVQSLRASMALGGGLRVDHVLGLFRLWWIPEGADATEGCYVHYRSDDLLDLVALESHRSGAWAVGEDLGTVPDGVREAMAERDLLGYRVLWFEDEPAGWEPLTMATVTTHDLPTVAGLWSGSDAIDQQESSTMDPFDIADGAREMRTVLNLDGLSDDASPEEAVRAAYTQLGRAPSLLRCLSLDDAAGAERRPNVPGTTERDNWSIPLPLPLEDLVADDRFRELPRLASGGDPTPRDPQGPIRR